MTVPVWDEAYTASAPVPWETGRPQPAFVRLAEQGLLSGRVLDSGCDTGEQDMLAADGADAMGVDVCGRAIQRARDEAAEPGLRARFEVANALNLGDLGPAFDARGRSAAPGLTLRGQGLGEVVDGLPADGLLPEVGGHPGRDG